MRTLSSTIATLDCLLKSLTLPAPYTVCAIIAWQCLTMKMAVDWDMKAIGVRRQNIADHEMEITAILVNPNGEGGGERFDLAQRLHNLVLIKPRVFRVVAKCVYAESQSFRKTMRKIILL